MSTTTRRLDGVTRWLNPDEQHAWRLLLGLNAQLMARLNRGLQESNGLSLPDYDVLVALTDATGSVRMRELGQKLQWDKSRLSKQVSRMAVRGLVERRDCPEDRRAAYVDLTEAGRAAIEAAAPAHVELVRTLIFDQMSAADVAALSRIIRPVLGKLEAEPD